MNLSKLMLGVVCGAMLAPVLVGCTAVGDAGVDGGAGGGAGGGANSDAGAECPTEWRALYNVSALQDRALALETKCSDAGVEIAYTQEQMPAACEPLKRDYEALEAQYASAEAQCSSGVKAQQAAIGLDVIDARIRVVTATCGQLRQNSQQPNDGIWFSLWPYVEKMPGFIARLDELGSAYCGSGDPAQEQLGVSAFFSE